MKVRAIRWTVLLAVALCAGCTHFDNPIVAESGPALDPALIGRWFASKDGDTMQLDIKAEGHEGLLVTTTVEKGRQPTIEDLRLITAQLDRLMFASAKSRQDDAATWMFCTYRMPSADLLVVNADGAQFWEHAVADKMIAGTIEQKPNTVTRVTVTAAEPELREFVRGYSSVIFSADSPIEFRRVPAD